MVDFLQQSSITLGSTNVKHSVSDYRRLWLCESCGWRVRILRPVAMMLVATILTIKTVVRIVTIVSVKSVQFVQFL